MEDTMTTWTPISAPTDFQDDAVFEVDFRTKTVQVLVEQPIVAGENLSQFIKFQAPRFYDNIDLTNMSVNILFVSPAGNKGISAAVNTEYSEDMIRCGWLVPYAACPVKGTLLFVLEFVGAEYNLKTTIASTPVLDSINDEDVVPEPAEQTWYITLQANVSATLQAAQTALGRIESIFNALSTPMAASDASEMLDESTIYVYTGSETGYTYGDWYYYDGEEWISGGAYASTAFAVDPVPTQGSTNAVSSGGVYPIKESLEQLDAIVNGTSADTTEDITDSVTWTAGGSVDSRSGGIDTSATNYSYATISLNGATHVAGSAYASQETQKGLAFLDADSVFLSGAYNTGATSQWGYDFDVPTGAEYLRISCRTENIESAFSCVLTLGESDGLVSAVSKLQDDVSTLRESIDDIVVEVTTDTTLTESGTPADAKATGDAISEVENSVSSLEIEINGGESRTEDITNHVTWENGKSVYYASGYLLPQASYSYADIPLGDAVSVSGTTFAGQETEKGLCFMDANLSWISGDYNRGATSNWAFSYTIPENAAYLRISCNTSMIASAFSCTLAHESSSGIKDVVSALESSVSELQTEVENISETTKNITLTQKRNTFKVGEGLLDGEYVSVESESAPTKIEVEIIGRTKEVAPGFLLTSKYWGNGGGLSKIQFIASDSTPAASAFGGEFDGQQYDKVSTLDDRTVTVSTKENGKTAYVLLKYNLIDEYEKRYGTIKTEGTKLAWIKKNVLNAVICRIYACGSGASGNGITFKQAANVAATSWAGSTSTTSDNPAELRRGLYLDCITDNGDVYFLIMANSASDGTIESTITLQFVEFVANFKPQYVSVGEHYFGLNSHGVTLIVDGVEYSYHTYRGLRAIDGVCDKIYSRDNNTIYERNIVNDFVEITGSGGFALEHESTGFKTVKISTSIFNGIKKDGAFLLVKRDGFKVKKAQAYEYECAWIANGYLYMTLNNADTGWIDSMTLNAQDISAYFYGYKMVNSSNGTYDGGTKYYRAIDNMNTPTTTVPTSARPNWFTPYKILYELETAVETAITKTHPICTIGDSVSISSGSVLPTINYSITVSKAYRSKRACDTAVFCSGEFGNLSEYEDVVSLLDNPTDGDVDVIINVNKSAAQQKFYGVGAAITGSAAYLLMTNLTATQRHAFLEECFSPKHGNFSAIRICIGGSDFQAADQMDGYTYADTENDWNLDDFSIGTGTLGDSAATKDYKYVLPVVKEIIGINPNVKVICSLWYMSVPSWLDPTTGNAQVYETLSWYFIRFIQEYKKHGVDIFALSILNEPEITTIGNTWSDKQKSIFVANYLAPKIALYAPCVKLAAFDCNYDGISRFTMIDDTSNPFWDAIAVHTYNGHITDEAFNTWWRTNRDKELYISERRCMMNDNLYIATKYMMGEIASDGIRHGVSLITLWNFVLNEKGEPTLNPGRRGVVTVRTNPVGLITRFVEYHMLRAIAHNVHPGAHVIKTTSPSKNYLERDVASTGFLNPDGSVVVALFNLDCGNRNVNLRIDGNVYAVSVPGFGISEFVLGNNINRVLSIDDDIYKGTVSII